MSNPASRAPRSAPPADADARGRILEAALDAFSENGFDGARTRDIARRAGVTLGLLQYHFGSKAALWRAAVDLAFSELRAGADSLQTEGSPRERLERAIRALVHFVGRHPEFVRLMHDEGKRRGPRARWLADRHVKPLYERLAPLIEEGQAAGLLVPDVAPAHLVYALVGAADGIFHQSEECRRVAGLDPTEESAIEAHARVVEALFLGGAPR